MLRSVIALLLAAPMAQAGAGLDCTALASEITQTICASDHLQELDQEFDRLATATREAGDLPEDSRADTTRSWLSRINYCMTAPVGAEDCIANSYVQRIVRLRKSSAAARAVQGASVGPVSYHCDGLDGPVNLVFVNISAPMVWLGWGPEVMSILLQAPSASGARYEGQGNSFLIVEEGIVWRGLTILHTKGQEAILSLSGGPELSCRVVG